MLVSWSFNLATRKRNSSARRLKLRAEHPKVFALSSPTFMRRCMGHARDILGAVPGPVSEGARPTRNELVQSSELLDSSVIR